LTKITFPAGNPDIEGVAKRGNGVFENDEGAGAGSGFQVDKLKWVVSGQKNPPGSEDSVSITSFYGTGMPAAFQSVAAEGHPAHPPPLAPGHAGAAAGDSLFEP
jgi:hypothetical protein